MILMQVNEQIRGSLFCVKKLDTRGADAGAGLVQVYHNGEWGTVCDDNWSSNDAKVACRELGYSKYVYYYHNGQGVGRV